MWPTPLPDGWYIMCDLRPISISIFSFFKTLKKYGVAQRNQNKCWRFKIYNKDCKIDTVTEFMSLSCLEKILKSVQSFLSHSRAVYFDMMLVVKLTVDVCIMVNFGSKDWGKHLAHIIGWRLWPNSLSIHWMRYLSLSNLFSVVSVDRISRF